jgi:hypothetical protein
MAVEGLEPVLGLARKVVEIIYQTKSHEDENAKLERPAEKKRIEPPKKKPFSE